MDRKSYADLVYNKITENKESLKEQYVKSKDGIGYFFLDDLLPANKLLLP